MVTLNLIKIKEEFLNLIRSGDVFDITYRKVTTTTDNIVGLAGSTVTLTNQGVKNIRSLKIDTVLQTLYVDYDINIQNKTKITSSTINLTIALTGGEDVEVVYDHSTQAEGDKIYSDFPEDHLTVGSFPRIGFEIDSIANNNRSSTDTLQQKNVLINFIVIAPNSSIDIYEQSLYDLIFANRKLMQNNNLARPSGRSGKEVYIKTSSTTLYYKMFSFSLPAEFEK
jgi:hypothetical protein